MRFIDSLLGRRKDARPEDGNPLLVHAMHELALNDNPDNRTKLYHALLGSMLLVPVPEIPKWLGPGFQTTNTEIQLHLTATVDRDNVRVTPAFTDTEALRNWDPNTPYLGIKAQELFRFVMGTDIQEVVINPFDPIRKMIRPGGRVTRAEIDLLAKGVVPSRIGPTNVEFQLKASDKVAIGLPAQPPSPRVEDLLQNRATSLPEVAELYLFQMATESGSSHTVIGIGLSTKVPKEREREIVNTMGSCVRPELEPGESLDFLFLHGPMGDQVRRLGKQVFPPGVSGLRNRK
jgi:type III secretion system (T3SS) SseB-like protein